jgi:hypothetical protein
VEATFIVRPPAGAPKPIYIGICGAGELIDDSCLIGQGWYDPRGVSQFSGLNPLSNDDLDIVANINSGLDSIGLRVGALHPNSVTIVAGFSLRSILSEINPLIRQNVQSVVDLVVHFYVLGDKVYLAGHSAGGAIVHGVADKLNAKGIPVQMTAQIDSIGLGDAKVPVNVTRAFNYFYPRNRSSRFAHFYRGFRDL